jgi:glutamine synthetase
MLFKMTAHSVAERHGSVFSCMPKPFAGAPGSGLHFHLSITDAQGRAVFTNNADPLLLSATGYQFVAGLLEHADALTALCAPTVNSYKRLACSESASGTTWSPVWKAYGYNNRTCVVRSVAGRLEWRLPDPSCNVYAAIAATLAAGLDGIESGFTAPAPCSEDLYERFAAGLPMPDRLPRDLGQSLDALDSNSSLTEAIGSGFCKQFLSLKRREWDDFSQSVSHWEFERYACLF